jgi:hypothetical protein
MKSEDWKGLTDCEEVLRTLQELLWLKKALNITG